MKLLLALIGSYAIMPLPIDEKTIWHRSKEFRCFDWWFCYKSLEYD